MLIIHVNPSTNRSKEVCEPSRHRPAPSSCIGTAISHKICRCKLLCPINRRFRNCDFLPQSMTTGWFTFNQTIFISNSLNAMTVHSSDFIPGITLLIHLGYSSDVVLLLPTYEVYFFRSEQRLNIGEFYQFNLSSCIRQQNSLTAQFVSFSLANLANIFYPPRFLQ